MSVSKANPASRFREVGFCVLAINFQRGDDVLPIQFL